MGDFAGGIGDESRHPHDVCPKCGDMKQRDSVLCAACSARQIRLEQAAKNEARERVARQEADAFYRQKLAEGWTYADIARHIVEERVARGDPPVPRFISEETIVV